MKTSFLLFCVLFSSLILISSTSPIGLILLGRNDVDPSTYTTLGKYILKGIENQLSVTAVFTSISSVSVLDLTINNITNNYNVEQFVLIAHSMTEGGIALQNHVKSNPNPKIKALILIASFLQRTQRPDVVECLPKASIKPTITWDKPLGYLKDGVHNCYGSNFVNFDVPTLSIGGELDGVVRITRFAEAYYTQVILSGKAKDLPVVVLEGVNHAILLNTTSIPPSVVQKDLKAEVTAQDALASVADVVSAFVGQQLGLNDGSAISTLVKKSGAFFDPFVKAFAGMEGNWFFTGADDEHGGSNWAAQAQTLLTEPLPQTYTWKMNNEFHLLSDEELIPPYYRTRHRPDVVLQGDVLLGTSVAQLRFIEVTPFDAGFGLNGWEIIKEEKLNILTALKDDGSDYVSSIEIAAKLMSRQKIFNLTGNPSPDSLDDGNRCGAINQKAYEWALSNLNPVSLKRFNEFGIPLQMDLDVQPFIPVGPFWIWEYLQFKNYGNLVKITAPYAFYSLSSNPYGAGNHYCKLLSPARAFEWMVVDGLRGKYSLV